LLAHRFEFTNIVFSVHILGVVELLVLRILNIIEWSGLGSAHGTIHIISYVLIVIGVWLHKYWLLLHLRNEIVRVVLHVVLLLLKLRHLHVLRVLLTLPVIYGLHLLLVRIES